MIDNSLEIKHPSEIPFGVNGQPLATQFYERLFYKEQVSKTGQNHSDFDLLNSNPMYGRVDHSATPIYLNETYLKAYSKNPAILALNFVIDNYHDLERYVENKHLSRQVNKESFTASLSLRSGWDSTILQYYRGIDGHLSDFVDTYLRKNKKVIDSILDYRSFVEEFVRYSRQVILVGVPVTRSGLILSHFFNPMSTGLMLEINSVSNDYSNDLVKYLAFYAGDSNFNFYKLAAEKFGFAVDPNAPWRLIAKIGSTPMINSMKNYNLTFENVFDKCYYRGYETDIASLSGYLEGMYNIFIGLMPTIEHLWVCSKTGRTMSKTVKRQALDAQSISQEEWLKFYFQIRNMEQGLNLPQSVITVKMRESLAILSRLGMSQALEYIEKTVGGLDSLAFKNHRHEAFKYKG